MFEYDRKRIRNFSIIAHIDHGKSTLADRLLELTHTVEARDMQAQYLDNMDLERERGITIKARPVTMHYKANDGQIYQINLIDTPGHVDFAYEVSRSLSACEGALLVVDAVQGVQAQTLANVHLAIERNLEILPIINKIDLPSADPDSVKKQIEEVIGIDASSALLISAKANIGIAPILERILVDFPAPQEPSDTLLRALVFDSHYDPYRGVMVYVRIISGEMTKKSLIRFMATGKSFEIQEVGVFAPNEKPTDLLRPGEVGYFVANIKSPSDVKIGDTITLHKNPAPTPLPGFKLISPVVFAGIYPIDSSDFEAVRDALAKLQLNDSALHVEQESSLALGFGFRNWTYALFYIMSELWGSVALSLLFWGFANDITRVSESKRFYAIFGLGANLGMVVSGPIIVLFSDIRSHLPPEVDAWGVTLNWMLTFVVISAFMVMGIYYWINKNVLTDPRFYDATEVKKTKKEKPKLSLKESFLFLARSPYISCLAIIVIGYGIAINLVEVTWKSQLKLQYPNGNEYNAFMGKFSFLTGITTILMMLFVGGNVIRRFGWGIAALVTPAVLLLTGTGFFSFIIFRDSLSGFISMLGTTPLMLAVLFGMAQNIMSKSAKYSLFDPTKEMAYIPLDQESKVKGKAAIDVVGARLGKSGGALIQQVLIVSFGSLAAVTPIIGGILLVIILAWMIAARALNKRFLALTAQKDAEATVKTAPESTEPVLAGASGGPSQTN